MGQVRHGCATTTHAMRAAIQRSQASIAALSRLYGINPKTVMKWRKRSSVEDRATGPKDPRSTVLTAAEEAIVVAFRRHTLLPLDDCLWSLQASIPHLTRSSLHRCLQRHGISRLPDADGDKPAKKAFKPYPIGFFHLDLAELRTGEGKLHLFIAIDRTSKFAFARLAPRANTETAVAFLEALLAAVPYQVHTILTDNGVQFADLPKNRQRLHRQVASPPVRPDLRGPRHRAPPDQAQPSLDEWPSRANEPDDQGRHGQALPLRQPRAAERTPRDLHPRLQLRPSIKDAQWSHPVRVHLPMLDKTTRTVQQRSNPSNNGTEHLVLVDHAHMRGGHAPAVTRADPGLHLPADLARCAGTAKQGRGDAEAVAVGGDLGPLQLPLE